MSSGSTWGYSKKNGPSRWPLYAPAALGRHQSPIDIVTKKAVFDKNFMPLSLNYNGIKTLSISNAGNTVKVNIKDSGACLSGGPLTSEYKLIQFHFHWGSNDKIGSEHSVNKKKYSAELHLVHWNNKYESYGEAVHNDDGLAVISVFMELGATNEDLEIITKALHLITFPGDQAEFVDFNVGSLLPENIDQYWTYKGSLTTPPCLEIVEFIIFKNPIHISKEQLKTFRTMLSSPASRDMEPKKLKNLKLVSNIRPVMPINDRLVYSSFQNVSSK